jgi:hypothetical protein
MLKLQDGCSILMALMTTQRSGAVAFDDFSPKRQPCYYVLLLLF